MSIIGDIVGSVAKAVLPAVIEDVGHAADAPHHAVSMSESSSGSLSTYVPPGGLHPMARSGFHP